MTFTNLIGNRYGMLTVVSRAENNHRGNTRWLCRCDCGNTKIALGYDLTHGRTTSCGCNRGEPNKPSEKRQDLVGKRFGRLTVVSLSDKRGKYGMLYWNCLCDCGNKVVTSSSNLKSGHSTSCGCITAEKNKSRANNLVGKRFGRLTVVKLHSDAVKGYEWECVCDCGRTKIAKGNLLVTGKTKSCGCLASHSRTQKRGKLSKDELRIHGAYRSMVRRCSPKYHCHKSYFDKGITVCDEWLGENGIDNFTKWSIENGYASGLSLDRIDNDGNYEPSNCRWASMKTQQNNKSNNAWVEYNGERKTIKQWSEEFGLSYRMLIARNRKGIKPPELFKPSQR